MRRYLSWAEMKGGNPSYDMVVLEAICRVVGFSKFVASPFIGDGAHSLLYAVVSLPSECVRCCPTGFLDMVVCDSCPKLIIFRLASIFLMFLKLYLIFLLIILIFYVKIKNINLNIFQLKNIYIILLNKSNQWCKFHYKIAKQNLNLDALSTHLKT